MFRGLVFILLVVSNIFSDSIIIKSDTNPTEELNKVLKQIQENKKLKEKEKHTHPLKRKFGYFIQGQNDIAKSILYLCKDDKKSLETILQTKSINPLKESKVRLVGSKCEIRGKYSLIEAAIRLEKLYAVKMIVKSMKKEELQNKYLQKMMTDSIYREIAIYHYLFSMGVIPNSKALVELSLYATLKDVKSAIKKGAKVDINETGYLRHAVQRDSYEIAKYYIENYDFNLDADPYGSSHFPSYLLYLSKLDSSKSENIAFFKFFVEKLSKTSIDKYGTEFIQRVKDTNPKFYEVLKGIDEFKRFVNEQ